MQVLGLYLHAVNKLNAFEQTGLMQILRAIFRSNLAIISQKGGERCDGYSYWLNILLIEILINPKHGFQVSNKKETPWNSYGGRIQVEKWAGREAAGGLMRQTTIAGWVALEQVLHSVPNCDAVGARVFDTWVMGFFCSWCRCSVYLESVELPLPSQANKECTCSEVTFFWLFLVSFHSHDGEGMVCVWVISALRTNKVNMLLIDGR